MKARKLNAGHPENIVEIRIARHVSRINHLNAAKIIILIIIIALIGMMISFFG